MSSNLLARYIWIVDTIRRHGRISRSELNEKWQRSPFSEGEPLPRRTFYSYRQAIEELFSITIECDPHTFDYYIGKTGADWDSAPEVAGTLLMWQS